MRIISRPDFMVAYFSGTGVWHRWDKGSHYVNVWMGGTEVDSYSFAWEKDHTSMLDFTTALVSYLSEE